MAKVRGELRRTVFGPMLASPRVLGEGGAGTLNMESAILSSARVFAA